MSEPPVPSNLHAQQSRISKGEALDLLQSLFQKYDQIYEKSLQVLSSFSSATISACPPASHRLTVSSHSLSAGVVAVAEQLSSRPNPEYRQLLQAYNREYSSQCRLPPSQFSRTCCQDPSKFCCCAQSCPAQPKPERTMQMMRKLERSILGSTPATLSSTPEGEDPQLHSEAVASSLQEAENTRRRFFCPHCQLELGVVRRKKSRPLGEETTPIPTTRLQKTAAEVLESHRQRTQMYLQSRARKQVQVAREGSPPEIPPPQVPHHGGSPCDCRGMCETSAALQPQPPRNYNRLPFYRVQAPCHQPLGPGSSNSRGSHAGVASYSKVLVSSDNLPPKVRKHRVDVAGGGALTAATASESANSVCSGSSRHGPTVAYGPSVSAPALGSGKTSGGISSVQVYPSQPSAALCFSSVEVTSTKPFFLQHQSFVPSPTPFSTTSPTTSVSHPSCCQHQARCCCRGSSTNSSRGSTTALTNPSSSQVPLSEYCEHCDHCARHSSLQGDSCCCCCCGLHSEELTATPSDTPVESYASSYVEEEQEPPQEFQAIVFSS